MAHPLACSGTLFLTIWLVGCSSHFPGDAAAARAAIEKANSGFIEAFQRGDRAAMMTIYADDAVVMMPNEPAKRGKAALDKGYAEFLSRMTFKEGSAKTEDLTVSGDLAVEAGKYEWTLQPKTGGEAISDRGKYVTVWKRQADGAWKIVRDINNSDLPAKQ